MLVHVGIYMHTKYIHTPSTQPMPNPDTRIQLLYYPCCKSRPRPRLLRLTLHVSVTERYGHPVSLMANVFLSEVGAITRQALQIATGAEAGVTFR